MARRSDNAADDEDHKGGLRYDTVSVGRISRHAVSLGLIRSGGSQLGWLPHFEYLASALNNRTEYPPLSLLQTSYSQNRSEREKESQRKLTERETKRKRTTRRNRNNQILT